MSTSFERFAPYSVRLEATLQMVLDEFEASLPPISSRATWALNEIRRYSTRSSKRLRGSLAAFVYDDASGQTYSEEGLRLGAAIEIMQNFLLITDDVIDRSTLRRGESTVHEEYKDQYESDEHEAHMNGVLVGGIAQHIASWSMLNINVSAQSIRDALRWLQKDIAITGIGQIDDIAQQYGRSISTEDLVRKYQQKSSYYSLVNPLTCGLTLAGKPDVRRDCELFGIPAGVAFQLRDDWLGLFGEPEKTGKPNLDDIHEGKHTIMVQYAAAKATSTEKDELERVLGNMNATKADLVIVQGIITRTGGEEAAMDDARSYGEQAKQAAASSNVWSEKVATILGELVDFSIERTR